VDPINPDWQSKLVLLLVLPFTAVSTLFQISGWAADAPAVLIWTAGLSLLLGLVAWRLRAATPAAALTGTLIAASLMFSTFVYPFRPWETALVPVLTVLVLTSVATRFGRGHKEHLGTAEERRGRGAAQVAANLGFAALVLEPALLTTLTDGRWFLRTHLPPGAIFAVGLAALSEAAADTLSSEIGQVLGGRPRMITTLRSVEPGTDGGITLQGTAVGILAAGIVAAAGSMALRGGALMVAVSWSGGVFGLLFDSLLGATLERRGWLNNDAVNFLSTASAAGFALMVLGRQ
jgi:uncharacterized protein (TIGR00297 family)